MIKNLRPIGLLAFILVVFITAASYKDVEASNAYINNNFLLKTDYTNFVSSDGSKIIGYRGGNRSIYISTTSGATFIPVTALGTNTGFFGGMTRGVVTKIK